MTPDLSHPLELEAPERLLDGAGGFMENWVSLGTLWAQLAPRSGKDASTGGAPVSRTAYRILVRAAPPGAPSRPVAGQRFRHGLRLFTITAVTEWDKAARYLNCTAEEEIAL